MFSLNSVTKNFNQKARLQGWDPGSPVQETETPPLYHRDNCNRADPHTEPNSASDDFSDSLNFLNSVNSMKVLLHLEKTPLKPWGFPKWSRTFIKFSEFRESEEFSEFREFEKSLEHELGSVEGSALLPMSLWYSGIISVSYTGDHGIQSSNPPFWLLIILPLNSKTFRENAITPHLFSYAILLGFS